MDLWVFKMICVPAWLPCHMLPRKPAPSRPDCLVAWKLLWFWARGEECGADDDTAPPVRRPGLFKSGHVQLSCCGQILSTVPYHMGRR